MNIKITNQRQNPKLEDHIRNRLINSIGRFSDRIEHVDVHVDNQGPQKGGSEKSCSIDLRLVPRGVIHVSAKNENIYAAATSAIDRAEKVITKAVDRGHWSKADRQDRDFSSSSDQLVGFQDEKNGDLLDSSLTSPFDPSE